MRQNRYIILLITILSMVSSLWGHRYGHEHLGGDSLEYVIPSGNEVRLSSGAPGPDYWQQQVDYHIDVEIQEGRSVLKGKGTITYHNNSPHELKYLWMQLNQNVFALDSERNRRWKALDFENETESSGDDVTFKNLRKFYTKETFEGGYHHFEIKTIDGEKIPHTIIDTNVRIDLKEPLKTGSSYSFVVKWKFPIPVEGHSFKNGYKVLDDGNKVYQIGQWYPRMCAYYDRLGWQNKPFLDYGEFASEFGDFEVSIKVPKDYIVAATGELQNSEDVLKEEILSRLGEATTSDKPVMIVNQLEADVVRMNKPAIRSAVWKYRAKNVRDFAFSCSRAYMWDAKGVQIDGRTVMAMSVYPKESASIWQRYSTETIAEALTGYSDIVLPFPYTVAWSTWGPIYGMEYPMISFQSSFDIEENGSYSLKARNYVIGVIVHEVGHNWFPMAINSDEREWTFLDEGINTFVESLVAPRFDRLVAGKQMMENRQVLEKMQGDQDDWIVVASDYQRDRGFQGYRKPTVALTVLREAVMGRELFDFALKEYARRWLFKRATPADFFRTMEDASGMDLDWFWQGWFYGSDHVDLEVDTVKTYQMEAWDPEKRFDKNREQERHKPRSSWEHYSYMQGRKTEDEEHLKDWYLKRDPFEVRRPDRDEYQTAIKDLEPWELDMINQDTMIHVVCVKNLGGLISPFQLKIVYEDDSSELLSIPASIWFASPAEVKIPIRRDKMIKEVLLDPRRMIADVDETNNAFPQKIAVEMFELPPDQPNPNPMKRDMNNAMWKDSD